MCFSPNCFAASYSPSTASSKMTPLYSIADMYQAIPTIQRKKSLRRRLLKMVARFRHVDLFSVS